MKVLIGVPSPRDIPEVLEALAKLPVDEYFVKYQQIFPAYSKIREFFLLRPEYDYLCIIPDDLIVDVNGFQLLLDFLDTYKPKLVSGVCNWNYTDMKDFWLVRSTAEPDRNLRKEERPFSRFEIVYSTNFSCQFIKREVVEKIPFRLENNVTDAPFYADCREKRIPCVVDWKAVFVHLANRKGDGTHENFYRDIKKPYEEFVPYSV